MTALTVLALTVTTACGARTGLVDLDAGALARRDSGGVGSADGADVPRRDGEPSPEDRDGGPDAMLDAGEPLARQSFTPDVAIGDGEIAVIWLESAWRADRQPIYGRRFDFSANPIGETTRLNTLQGPDGHAVITSYGGGWAVAYVSDFSSYVIHVDGETFAPAPERRLLDRICHAPEWVTEHDGRVVQLVGDGNTGTPMFLAWAPRSELRRIDLPFIRDCRFMSVLRGDEVALLWVERGMLHFARVQLNGAVLQPPVTLPTASEDVADVFHFAYDGRTWVVAQLDAGTPSIVSWFDDAGALVERHSAAVADGAWYWWAGPGRVVTAAEVASRRGLRLWTFADGSGSTPISIGDSVFLPRRWAAPSSRWIAFVADGAAYDRSDLHENEVYLGIVARDASETLVPAFQVSPY